MPSSVQAQRAPRLVARIAAVEAGLLAVELAACALPLAWSVLTQSGGPHTLRALGPLVGALIVALALRLAGSLRPVATIVAARARAETVSAEAGQAAQRALARAPWESASLRLVLWAALAGALAARAARWPAPAGVQVSGVVSLVLFHAIGLAALRFLLLELAVSPWQRMVLPHVEGIRIFAAAYRVRLITVALATLGLAHAAWALAAWALGGAQPATLARATLLLWPTLIAAALPWLRSLLRRTNPIEQLFDATLRSPGTRGPARDEPRAVAAFIAAQSLPYRLALYQAFSLALATVMAVAVVRRVGGVSVAGAARLLVVAAAVIAVATLYQALALRASLRPLLRHIGSRHFLPVAQIRSAFGLRAKLLIGIVALIAIACLALTLWAGSVRDLRAHVALAVMMLLVLGLVVLIVREVVNPIQALEGRSEEMARGELARPVPPSGEADEIGRLTVAFEEMRRSLRDRLRSTESINVDLEREVRRRTEAMELRNADLRQALDKLRRAQDDLVRSEKLASMGRLVAGIAHEINNPVNAVINSLGPLEEVLRQLPRASAGELMGLLGSAEEMLAVVQRGAVRTKAIVQALHNYSRADETIQREVSLARSLDDSLDLLRHRLGQVKVTKRIDPAARILGFPGQVDQILMNLLTNAAQALGEEGGEVRVSAETLGAEVVLEVSDDGPGIPEEVLPRIFDPFFTTKDVGEGSGLGLSIVHGLVERHGGRIEVDSVPGKGTTFRITFPRRGAGAAAAASPP